MAVIQQSAGSGEDVNHPISDAGLDVNATTYATFTVKMVTGAVIGTGQDYFAHFRPAGTDSFNFVARTWIGPPTAGGDFRLGIAAGSLGTTPVVPWPNDLLFGQEYQLVIAYDGVTGTSTLWLDPVDQGSPSVSSTHISVVGRALRSFALRQSSPAGATYSQHIDEVRCSDSFGNTKKPVKLVPTLSQWGMLLLGSLLMFAGTMFAVRRRNGFA